MRLTRLLCGFCLLVLTQASLLGQDQNMKRGLSTIGVESQLYPAGIMTQLKASWSLSAKSELIGKFGYNLARRQDFGKHDNEEGGGFGGGVAWRRYIKEGHHGWFAEARLSFWRLSIDWEDNNPPDSGTTKISVFQPTFGFGYDFLLNNDRIKVALLAGFGYEVNMVTEGDPVGEGGISLVGASIAFKLK